MAGEREWAAPVKAAASGAGWVQYWWAEEAAGGAGRADEASAGAMAVAERAEGAGVGVGGRRRPAPVRRSRASSSTRKKRMEEKEKIEGMTSGPIDDCFNGVKINHNLFLCNPLTKQKIGSDPTLSTKH